jgi:hypothetical protein
MASERRMLAESIAQSKFWTGASCSSQTFFDKQILDNNEYLQN